MARIRLASAVLATACLVGMLTPGPAAIAGPHFVSAPPGYWLAGSDGGVFAFNAPFLGSGVGSPGTPGACSFSPQPPSTLDARLGCRGIASTPGGDGYWLTNLSRLPTGYGTAPSPASVACSSLNGAAGVWSGMASSPTGLGFELTSSNGAVLDCGDAAWLGGMAGQPLHAPVVGMAATPDGGGYWLVASDGGVFAFGDAAFYGSEGGLPLRAPVVGIAATPDGNGYWLVASDGGVFAFGDAVFDGSMGGLPLDGPVVGMASTADDGYWLAASDGGVFAFGTAPFQGSLAGTPLNGPVVGIAPYRPPAR